MKQAKTTASKTSKNDKEVVRINPMFNDVFLRVFGCQDSKEATRGLLNSIFRAVDIPEIGEIDSIAAEVGVIGNNIMCKSGRADVVLVSGNMIVDLEAQGYREDIANKVLFYTSKLLVDHTMTVSSYEEMPQVVGVILLENRTVLPDSDQIVSLAELRWSDDNHALATDRLLLVLVELDKVVSRYNEAADVVSDELLSWLYVLSTGYQRKSEVEQLMIEFKSIEEFAKLYGIAIDDPDIKQKYDLYHRQVMEANSTEKYLKKLEQEAVDRGLEQGLEQGLEEGYEQGEIATLAKLQELGLIDEAAIEAFMNARQ